MDIKIREVLEEKAQVMASLSKIKARGRANLAGEPGADEWDRDREIQAELKQAEDRLVVLAQQEAAFHRYRDEENQEPAARYGSDTMEPADPSKLPTPFRSLGAQLAAVARASQNPYHTDPGLLKINAAAQGSNEGVDSEGGFLVQVDFTGELLQLAHETGVLPNKTDRRPIGANSNGMKMNAVDETSRANGSRAGGIQAYWTGEAGAMTATKPAFRQMQLSLQKLTGLYYATDEELQDATSLAGNVAGWFGDEFGFKLDDAIVRGTGAGMPLGILAHAGTVSVTKETNQAAATIVAENIEKMYSRMLARSLPRAEWYINQDCWPQLFQLQHTVGVGGVPVFLPAGGLSGAPYGTLLGRPVMPIEQCETVGTVGDIILADFQQYLMIEKGGIDAASSIHVQFLTNETTFRFVLRTDGQPKRNAVLTPFKGSNTQSSFITLATRA